ncbi:hypothetical protein XcodCFBP4690_04320 [Xanthomonas codiaei]|uniref:Uncharacterized protein n=1 Tax=Xanthomonas codiaei TaxID=56463 RepID=A0A2S7CVX8_9XANT|nr:hypothetical protein XcodCFBP4690_04320 [Xanthomonas codiaei]
MNRLRRCACCRPTIEGDSASAARGGGAAGPCDGQAGVRDHAPDRDGAAWQRARGIAPGLARQLPGTKTRPLPVWPLPAAIACCLIARRPAALSCDERGLPDRTVRWFPSWRRRNRIQWSLFIT